MNSNNFKFICDYYNHPIKLMQFFVDNIKGKSAEEEFKIYWPDRLLKEMKGSCFDFSIFIKEYCEYRNIEYAFIFIEYGSISIKKPYYGHVFPVFKDRGGWYIWNYFATGLGDVHGPFETPEDAGKEAAGYFIIVYKSLLLSPNEHNLRSNIGPLDYVVSDYIVAYPAELKIIDQVKKENKDNYNLEQKDILTKDSILKVKMSVLDRKVCDKIQKYELSHNRKNITHSKVPIYLPSNLPTPNIFKSNNSIPILRKLLSGFNEWIRR